MSDIEQACDAGQANLRRDVAVGLAGGTMRYAGCPHARISTGILSGYCRDRAASLSEVQPESHAALEAWGGTIRLRSPYIRVPEVRSRSHHGGIQRPHEFRYQRLACQRTKAAEISTARESLDLFPRGLTSLGELTTS